MQSAASSGLTQACRTASCGLLRFGLRLLSHMPLPKHITLYDIFTTLHDLAARPPLRPSQTGPASRGQKASALQRSLASQDLFVIMVFYDTYDS